MSEDKQYENLATAQAEVKEESLTSKMQILVHKAVENTIWRQQECVNLIPSPAFGNGSLLSLCRA